MKINLFAWIIKMVSLKLAAGGDIIVVVKNKIFLVRESQILCRESKQDIILYFFHISLSMKGRTEYMNQRTVGSKVTW